MKPEEMHKPPRECVACNLNEKAAKAPDVPYIRIIEMDLRERNVKPEWIDKHVCYTCYKRHVMGRYTGPSRTVPWPKDWNQHWHNNNTDWEAAYAEPTVRPRKADKSDPIGTCGGDVTIPTTYLKPEEAPDA